MGYKTKYPWIPAYAGMTIWKGMTTWKGMTAIRNKGTQSIPYPKGGSNWTFP